MGENAAQEVGAAMLFYPKSMSFYFDKPLKIPSF